MPREFITDIHMLSTSGKCEKHTKLQWSFVVRLRWKLKRNKDKNRFYSTKRYGVIKQVIGTFRRLSSFLDNNLWANQRTSRPTCAPTHTILVACSCRKLLLWHVLIDKYDKKKRWKKMRCNYKITDNRHGWCRANQWFLPDFSGHLFHFGRLYGLLCFVFLSLDFYAFVYSTQFYHKNLDISLSIGKPVPDASAHIHTLLTQIKTNVCLSNLVAK